MPRQQRTWTLFGASLGAISMLAAVVGLGVIAGNGVAAQNGPYNTSPPTISGSPQIGQTLTVSNGSWSGPGTITFSYQWLRCDNTGGGCTFIAGAVSKTYPLTSADVGHSLRARVTARNDNGSTAATTI